MQSKPTDRLPYFDKRGQRVPGVYTRKRADGSEAFVIGYRATDGRQRWQTIPGGITAARAALADVQSRKARGERVTPNPRLTFAQAAEAWWSSQAANLRPATQRYYRSLLDVHLLPELGRTRLDQITVDRLARFVALMGSAEYRAEVEARTTTSGRGRHARRAEAAAGGYKAWTIRGALTVLGRVFDYARRRIGWAGQNPVRDLDRSERPRSDQRERRVLTTDEVARLLTAADHRHRPVFEFAALTGSRLGEVLGLKWRSVDLDHGTATIDHQADRHGGYVELKTKRSRRTIELPSELVASLRARKLAAEYSGPDAYVFSTSRGTPFEHRNVSGRALARAIKRAGLDADPERLPTFHSLRHSFASAWIASGGDVVELSAHLGHADPAITLRVYSHEFATAAHSEARRARLDAIFGSSVVAADGNRAPQTATPEPTNIASMQAKRDRRR